MPAGREITIIIVSLGRGGGAEQVCINVVNSLSGRGWRVNLFVVKKMKSDISNKLNDTVMLRYFTNNKLKIGDMIKLHSYIVQNHIKKVLIFSYSVSIILILLRIFSFKKYTIISRCINTLSVSGTAVRISSFEKMLLFCGRLLYKRSDLVIAQCEGMKNDLVEKYGIKEDKIVVINNPIKQEICGYLQQNHPESKEKDYLLCAGRLERQKGFHFAIEAFARIHKDYPELRLKIIGEGTLFNNLKKLAADSDIGDKVDFEGYKADVIPYYVNARLTLLTSLFEGYPNVVVESLALGTPVVAFDCPSGPRELVENGKNGYLADYCNVFHLEKCVKDALGRTWDPVLVTSTVRHLFPDSIIGQYEKVLDSAR